MPGTSAVGGLISGLDTATIIDQLIAVSRKRIDAVVANQTTHSDELSAYQSLNTNLSDFKSKADILRNIDTFNVFKTAISTDSTNFKASDLLSVSTTTDANPGTHTIKFTTSSQLAQARQLSSQSYSSSTTALNLSGEFVINDKAISISTTDTLADIAVSINNANSGTNATGVTASILTITSTDNRLILTSDNTGKDKFSILDASASGTNILQGGLTGLGFTTSSTTIKTPTSDGAQSDKFSSSNASIKSLLGLTNAQSSTTVNIAGTNVTIDLATDTLTTIASTINGIAGVTATVASTTTDGVETFFIDISGTTNFTDNNNILETLGILEGTNASVNEVHAGSVANTKLASAIVATDKFNEIDGASVGTTDTITIQGTKNDGTAITSTTYNIYSGGTYNDINNLLTAIETQYGGVSVVDAYISDGTDGNTAGEIAIRDLTAGDSQISLTLLTNNEGGGALDFGTIAASTQGYDMQAAAGQDANVEIDGVGVTRDSNSIDDVINGVTIDLARVESGTTVDLTISRDTDSIKSSVNDFITEYNGIIEFINLQFTFDEDTESSGVLAGESALSTIKSTIQSTITSTNSLLPANHNALSLIGITSDKNGKLSLNDSDFLSAINTDFNAVRRLFTAEGTTTNSEITFVSHTKETVAGDYAVVINTVATQATVTGTGDLSSGIGGAGDVLDYKITDTLTGREATITLDGSSNGSSLDNIVNAINSELATEFTQTLVGDKAQLAGGFPITSSTTFGAIDGETLNQYDEVISISGTTRSGISTNNTFTISDKDTTTIQDFLSFIENTYNNEVSATIDGSGQLVLTENTIGDSLLTITITEPAGKGVDFGNVTTGNPGGVTGRYAMEITASKSGNNLVITHDNYGNSNGFSTSETVVGGAPTLPSTTTGSPFSGIDVAGTINGEAATGVGQLLTGDAPPSGGSTSIEGLSIKVTSTTTGSKGNVKLTIGVAEEMFRELDYFTDQFDGLVTVKIDGLQDTIDNLQDTINDMEARLVTERTLLENQFVQLELSLSKLQTVSSFLSQQLGSLTNLLS
ncbi:MAG: flagellar filament capping protein FliD [Candidatus Scalinduaceae bacterium]